MRHGRWILGALAASLAAPVVWFFARPQPEPVTEDLAPGLRYQRLVRDDPRQILHVVTIDLAAGARFVVTAGDPGEELPLRAETTSAFARTTDVDVALNGDFFSPWHSRGPLDYYPHVGDPVAPTGFAAASGVSYGRPRVVPGATLFVTCDGAPTFSRPADLCEAISGQPILVAGEMRPSPSESRARHPRTAICLDETRQRFLGLVIDGRQPGYSVGARWDELGEALLALGCHDAINLDGGGSSTLVLRRGGEHVVASMPIHTRIPGRERPIANHLGVRLAPPTPTRAHAPRGRGLSRLGSASEGALP
ncbi:MAG: phosphodiester glycosidase family protein [Myxococcales bacterium]|nr:phosphodiester glycosidase family protein [Myxococcales bacterium]